MVNRGRVDYFIDFPFSYQQVLKQLPSHEQQKYTYFPIAEAPRFQTVYAMCNNNEAGQKIINAINQAVQSAQYKTKVTARLLDFVPNEIKEDVAQLNWSLIGKVE